LVYTQQRYCIRCLRRCFYYLHKVKFEDLNLKVSQEEYKKGEPGTVEFAITNTGKVEGAEVTQLYVRDVQSPVLRPIKELKGFKKVSLNPGESKTVKIELNEKDFSYWDENKKDWNAEAGEFEILVGAASNDIKLKATIKLL